MKLLPFILLLCLTACGKITPMGGNADTDPANYPKTVADWKKWGLAGHFPATVPESATRVIFAAYPGFLQAGAWIQLRVELPPAEVRRIYDDAQKITREYHDGGDSYSHENGLDGQKRGLLPSTSFYTSDSEITPDKRDPFPPDYRVFILDAQPYKPRIEKNTNTIFSELATPPDRPDWNHGTSRGLAVSLPRNEVVYWAESW